jgi:hypothetical protein
MLIFDPKNKKVSSNAGGYLNAGLPIRSTYVTMRRQHGMFYEPIVHNANTKIGVVLIHSDGDYSTINMCGELAKRGFLTFGGQVSNSNALLSDKLLDVKNAVDFLHCQGAEKVVLMGHSGGATLMSAYQAVAENGDKIFQGDDMLVKCHVKEPLTPADGIMTIDSNWGNGSMTLFSVDPAVVENGNGMKLDPEFDIFNPANGYDPAGSHYTEAFLKKYLEAQKERNNAIIKEALERLHALENGKGYYADDEPFIVTGGSQLGPVNKLFPEDTSLFAHTKAEHTLLHGDGSATTEIVHSVRPPHGDKSMTSFLGFGTVVTTVRHYLDERSVLAGEDYNIKADGAYGVLWDRSYDCTPGNIKYVHVPTLCMGFTGSYEYLAAEEIYNNSPSTDKSIAFTEGASHMFAPIDAKYGDCEKVTYDHVAAWLSKPGRFID